MTHSSFLRHVPALTRLLVALLASHVTARGAQAQGVTPPLPCDCTGAFDRTVARVEQDYVGFPLETRPPRDTAWRAHVAALRPRAARLDAPDCSWLLRSLVRFFRDGHLLVIDMPARDTAGVEGRRLARPTVDVTSAEGRWNPANLLSSLRERRSRGEEPAPVEGIWRGPGYRVGVLRDPGDGNRATGVLLDAESGRWRPGQVRAEFVNLDGEWRATVWDDDFNARTSPVEFSRGALMRMAPLLWGRVDSSATLAMVHTADPRLPVVAYPDDSSAVLSVVTLDPLYGRALSTLVDAEWERLRARPHLVIDLRGNEGGSSGQVQSLLPFLWQAPDSSSVALLPDPADALVRSSPATIAFWDRAGWAPKGLVDRLRSVTPGALVPFDPSGRGRLPRPPVRLSRPDQRVDILVDGATVSAAEQVVLWARAMGRARIIGEPTGGSIDYQSTWLSRVACAGMGQVVSVPLIATSEGLPNAGFNAGGIVPDRRLRTDGEWWGAARARAGSSSAQAGVGREGRTN